MPERKEVPSVVANVVVVAGPLDTANQPTGPRPTDRPTATRPIVLIQ